MAVNSITNNLLKGFAVNYLFEENNDRLLDAFIGIFIFSTFNRTFRLFEIDLRYIGLFLETVLIFRYFLNNLYIKKIDNNDDFHILMFYIVTFFSLIRWKNNYVSTDSYDELIKVIILNVYNFLAFLVIAMYREQLEAARIEELIIFSGIIMITSMMLVYLKVDIPNWLIQVDSRIESIGTAGGEHHNIFGQSFRVAGFAEDANYATLFSIVTLIIALKKENKILYKFILTIICMIGIAISFSRTVIVGFLVASIIVGVSYALKARMKNLECAFFLLIFGVVIITPFVFDYFNIELNTLLTRFVLWKKAAILFNKSRIFGNGLASFRYFNSSYYRHGWIVQSHCTYWQILAETGILGALSYIIMVCGLIINTRNNYYRLLVFVYVVFAINFETVYLQYFILTVCLMRSDKCWDIGID